ncbi:FecCD family ABC transporter permease [Methanomethylophilus alvi]|uniref:FecCD family ABC transporter permease n=1 Tax=Methanomethylophilus alvi TaxID=1291540 RepID=UPI0037DD388F
MTPDDEGPTKDEVISEYHHLMARRLILLLVCIVGIILFVGLFSLSAYEGISLSDTYHIIWNHICGNEYEKRSLFWWADRYIWNTAIPHALVAIIAGASLAVCGALMQSLMGNPLADPYSTGISSGACFGAVAAIVVGVSFSSVTGEMGIVTNAFIGALIPAMLIIFISERVRMTPATLILLGTAISYFFNSMITYVMVTTDADTLKSAYLWQVGSLDGMTWSSVPLMLAVTIVGSAFVMMATRKLNVMSLGENSAISLGIDVQKFRIICLALMAVMTAAIVSYTGIIGFVGLVAPHIVRLVIGSDNKFVVPISMAVGAFLLLFADYIAYQLSNIPVGVVMSLIGSPVFFILIVLQSRKSGVIY